MKEQALKLFHAGRLPEAHRAFTEACRQSPADVDCRIMLGVVSAQLGALPQAITHLLQATQMQPGSAAAWSNLGLAQFHANQLPEAETSLRRAIELNPKDAFAYNNLGALYRQQGRIDAALKAYQMAIKCQPRDANAHNNLGVVLQGLCRADESMAAYRRALKLLPNFAQAHFNLGSVLQSEGRHEQALHHFQKALKLDPDLVDVHAAMARIQEKEGHFEQARQILEPYLKSETPPVSVVLAYAAVARRIGEADQAVSVLEAVLQRADLSGIDRQEAEFALGDLLDQQHSYDAAFSHYACANSLRPFAYDPITDENYLHLVQKCFPEGCFAQTAPDADRAPVIFIVGMPRSSTSLVEQILASHPDVHGGGELSYVSELVVEYSEKKKVPFLMLPSHMNARELRAFGRRYVKKIQGLNARSRFVTDKMPHNFLHIGLLAQALPNVRFVHCRRNPLDTCLSIYFHNFNANHPYATDLANLGRYYRFYEALMSHWRSVLGGQILDVSYEEMLTDQEGTSRRLLEFCGLDWREECLSFYESKRIVNTPSYDQVRRPLYSTSRERWRHYEKHIGPLIQTLGVDG